MFGNDLKQILAGQVVAAFEIDNLNIAPLADKTGDVVKGHIIAGLGVI